MQDKTIPGPIGAHRWLADLMETHGLTAKSTTVSDHVHINGTFSYTAMVISAADLEAWAVALGEVSFESRRSADSREPICAAVRSSIDGAFVGVTWWTNRIPRVIVPAEGTHRSPLCSLEPLTGSAAA